jgi:hypothetical protein
MVKYRAKHDLEAGYDTDYLEVKGGTVLTYDDGIIYYGEKAVCDSDSPMCFDDLEQIEN